MITGPRMSMSFRVAAKPRATDKGFAELSVVRLLHDVDVDGQTLPAGASGTVVGAYAGGVGYEVEFDAPFHAVVTLEATDIDA